MLRYRKPLFLLLIAAALGGAAHWTTPAAAPDLCFTAGTVTYRLSSHAAATDYRVTIDNAAAQPDFRVRLVDRVEAADFALTDDAGSVAGNACQAAGTVKTVRVVPPGQPSDITIAVARDARGAGDFSLYVHSSRVNHFDAAALFALIRQAPDADRELDGEQLAEVR
jgi:hypothetical protein